MDVFQLTADEQLQIDVVGDALERGEISFAEYRVQAGALMRSFAVDTPRTQAYANENAPDSPDDGFKVAPPFGPGRTAVLAALKAAYERGELDLASYREADRLLGFYYVNSNLPPTWREVGQAPKLAQAPRATATSGPTSSV